MAERELDTERRAAEFWRTKTLRCPLFVARYELLLSAANYGDDMGCSGAVLSAEDAGGDTGATV